jgi:hypothetical protein
MDDLPPEIETKMFLPSLIKFFPYGKTSLGGVTHRLFPSGSLRLHLSEKGANLAP